MVPVNHQIRRIVTCLVEDIFRRHTLAFEKSPLKKLDSEGISICSSRGLLLADILGKGHQIVKNLGIFR